MIPVKITRNLYIRKGPGRGYESLGNVLPSGKVINMEGTVTGESYQGINNWYFLTNTNGVKQYYWGGGVETISTDLWNRIPDLDWWIKDYGIDSLWSKTRGHGIKIAIIDSGLDFNHRSIRSKKNILYYNILNNSTKPEDCIDTDGHGTHCAGMIAAQGPDIFGVAPDSDIIIIKATVNGDLSCQNAALAINQAVKLGANIISISYEYRDNEDDFDKLSTAMENARNNNVLIVASTGNSGDAGIISEIYPASFSGSIGVGAIDKKRNFWEQTKLTKNISILSPGVEISLLGLNDTIIIESGTSYATPFTAGVCSLFMSLNNDIDLLSNKINTTAENVDRIGAQLKNLYPDNVEIPSVGIIAPKKIFT